MRQQQQQQQQQQEKQLDHPDMNLSGRKRKRTEWEFIPTELLVLIFEYLDDEVVLRVACVNKTWMNVAVRRKEKEKEKRGGGRKKNYIKRHTCTKYINLSLFFFFFS